MTMIRTNLQQRIVVAECMYCKNMCKWNRENGWHQMTSDWLDRLVIVRCIDDAIISVNEDELGLRASGWLLGMNTGSA
jgi:hypothetical protein